MTTPTLSIPREAWSGTPNDPDDGRLSGIATINGGYFHLEAIPVRREDGVQVGVDEVSESRLAALAVEFDVRGFETIEIDGRAYVVVITPFGS